MIDRPGLTVASNNGIAVTVPGSGHAAAEQAYLRACTDLVETLARGNTHGVSIGAVNVCKALLEKHGRTP